MGNQVFKDKTLELELKLFFQLRDQLKLNPWYKLTEIDQYGFEIITTETMNSGPVIMICGLTHGNEVLGLQVINQVLSFLSQSYVQFFKCVFLLNNYEAYRVNQRYVDFDLNRSFKHEKTKSVFFEYKRSKEIEKIILKIRPDFILDLHQTIEPTRSSFFILPEASDLIYITRKLHSNWPIVCFDQKGFSSDGYTLLEFALDEKIACVVLEMSQNGFNLEKSQEVSNWILKSIIENSGFLLETSTNANQRNQNIEYFKIRQKIEKKNQQINYLKSDFINLDLVQKNQIIGYSENPIDRSQIEIKSLFDGFILFPKYGEKAEQASELGLIAERKTFLKIE